MLDSVRDTLKQRLTRIQSLVNTVNNSIPETDVLGRARRLNSLYKQCYVEIYRKVREKINTLEVRKIEELLDLVQKCFPRRLRSKDSLITLATDIIATDSALVQSGFSCFEEIEQCLIKDPYIFHEMEIVPYFAQIGLRNKEQWGIFSENIDCVVEKTESFLRRLLGHEEEYPNGTGSVLENADSASVLAYEEKPEKPTIQQIHIEQFRDRQTEEHKIKSKEIRNRLLGLGVNSYDLSNYYYSCDEEDYVVDNLIRTGDLVLVSGDPKSGKTNFAYNLIKSILFGERFLGHECNHVGKILVIQNDERVDQFKNKLFKIFDGRNVSSDKLEIFTGLFLESDEQKELFQQFCREEEIKLVVIDNLSRVCPSLDQNKPEIMSFVHYIQKLSRELGITFIVIHHNNKSIGKGISKVRGYSGITAEFDLIFVFKDSHYDREKNVTVAHVDCIGRMIPTENYVLMFNSNLVLEDNIMSEEEYQNQQKEEEIVKYENLIIDYLDSVDRPVSLKELSKSLNCTPSIIKDVLDRTKKILVVTRYRKHPIIGLVGIEYSFNSVNVAIDRMREEFP